jgi:hypothetical protein
MTRILYARIALTLIGIAIWGYGQRYDDPRMRIAGMGVLFVVLVLRFAPKRWFDDAPR